MTQSTRMTEGNLWKQILIFSLPLMLSNLLQVLFNIADIAVIGQFGGSLSLGAVGSTVTLVTLFTGFLIGLGSGVNVLAARAAGAKNNEELSDIVHTSAVFCFLAGLAIMITSLGGARFFLQILHTRPELIDGAELYLKIYFLGMPALAIYNFGSAVLSAIGDTRRPLFYLTAAGVLNIVLNLCFVIVCKLDVAGVALASILSQYLSAGLILIPLFRTKEAYGLHRKKLRMTPSKVKELLSIGVPAGLQNAIFQVANLFIQLGVNSFDAVVVAGNAAAANADALVYDVMAAFCTACSSFIGQNYGAGKQNRILKSYFISLAYAFGSGLLLGFSLVFFGEAFLSLFTPDPAVIAEGMRRLAVMGISYALSAFVDCTISASRGLGKSLVPTVIVVLGSCVFRIVWVYTIFAWFHTITVLYLLYSCSWIITALAEIWYFRKIYRQMFGKHRLTA